MDRKCNLPIKVYPHHFQNGSVNPRHLLCAQKGKGTRDQTLVVDGADLIDQKVGIPLQAIPGVETQAKGCCIFRSGGSSGG
jgi:hypothetical protein